MPLLSAPLSVFAALCAAVFVSELLVRRTWLRHVGTSLLVIVVTSVLANARVVPTYGQAQGLYDVLMGEVIGVAIFWLMLKVRLSELRRAGPQMLGLFAIGALGIAIGVPVGLWVVDGPARFGEQSAGLGAMFVGTYTGGSVNFNTMAEAFGVVERPALYAGAAVVDSLMTTIWMVIGVLIPRWARGRAARADDALQAAESARAEPDLGIDEDTEALHPADLALALALGAGALAASRAISAELLARFELALHPLLVITVLALVVAQHPIAARLRGTRLLGMFGVYLFLAAIGALCDVDALLRVGDVGGWLFLFVLVTLTVHGLLCFGAARAFGLSADVASVASQANVGGGSTALALARSLGRGDLVLPAILVGNLGTAAGSLLGAAVGRWVLGGELVG